MSEEAEDVETHRMVLTGLGRNVRTCRTYSEGVRCLDSGGFDFVIVSYGSPNFEGRSVLERANEIDRRLPVLVMARCLDMHCYLEGIELGAMDYLAEPITAQELGRALETYLRLRADA